ncbi:MAG: hypothetical protein WDA20_13685 [Desulfuromonadales bacterium]
MKTALYVFFTFFLLAAAPCQAAMRQIASPVILAAPAVSALAADNEDRIYLADSKGAVHIVSPSGEAILSLAAKTPDGRPTLQRPRGIAVHDGKIYIADEKLERIVLFDTSGAYLGGFGNNGGEQKEFDSPSALAVCRGHLFVADTGNDRVQVFSLDGIYLATIGRAGDGDALLREPTQIAVDPRGRLVILDDGRIKLFSPTGEFLQVIETPYRPGAIAADYEGILLADKKTLRVVKLDYDGQELFAFGSKGKDRSQFYAVGSMALSPCGRMLVGDPEKGVVHVLSTETCAMASDLAAPPALTSVRVAEVAGEIAVERFAIAADGTIYGIVPGKEKSIAVIRDKATLQNIRRPKWNPVALSVAADGSLWVLDARESKVLHLSPDGELLNSFGSSGAKDGSFDDPADLLVSATGLVYVADMDNRRVQVFNAGGILLHVLGGDREKDLFKSPVALALDGQENLFVLDNRNMTVTAFDPAGRKFLAFGGAGKTAWRFTQPVALAVTGNEIQVLDAGLGGILVFDRKGEYLRSYAASGKEAGDLYRPTDLTALNDTDVLVADHGNQRLQTYQTIYTPAAPTEVAGATGPRLVTLNWRQNDETYVSGYKVYRSEAPDAGYGAIAATATTTLEDAAVKPDTAYYYRVTALARHGNESAASAAVEIAPTRLLPPLPTELTATPQEWSIDLAWAIEQPEIVGEYRIYRRVDGKDTLLGASQTPAYHDGNLDPETAYDYELTAVSIDGIESARVAVKATTLATTRPPIEIAIESLDDIYSNTYKLYEDKGIGQVRITNNTGDRLAKIKVTFTLKDFMDFPSEVEINDLEPRTSKDLTLKPIFNNLILNLTEDTSVQAEIVASFYRNQKLATFSKIQPLRLFEKHRMSWDEQERFAAFVTPKDPIILEFSRGIASQFSDFADPILFAGVAFDALGMTGLAYLQDPSNPYQITSEQTDYVDYIQYPRETLARKSGDCDDLVGLYSAILESLGIRTQVVEVPGHMFLMFETSLDPKTVGETSKSMYVENADKLWVPVEVTKVGGSFMKAWDVGLVNYRKFENQGLTLMDVRAAWGTFKPANLPLSDWRAPAIGRKDLENRFKDEVPTLRKIRLQNLGQKHLAQLRLDPQDSHALLQLGILYARAGEPREAVGILEKACSLLPGEAMTHNNLGNAYYMLEEYAKAEAAYRKAAGFDAGDPGILVNLARVQLRLKKKGEATASFQKAVTMSPEIGEKYRSLAITLGSTY